MQISFLDIAIAVWLCGIFPGFQIYRVLRSTGARPDGPSAGERSCRIVILLGVPLVLLGIDWWIARRAPSALGLGTSVTLYGQLGLAVAAIAILGVVLTSFRPNSDPQKVAELRARLEEAGMMVYSRGDLVRFVLLALLIGCGTEILFRGFLVWMFAPLAGIAGAVVIAALAYGLGHGDKTWQRALPSLVRPLRSPSLLRSRTACGG